jgi:tetratricopeptide (TPR) repeat protein
MRRKKTLVVVTTAGIAAAAALLGGGAFSGAPRANPLAVLSENALGSPGQRAVGRLLAGLSRGDTAGYVGKLERRVAGGQADGGTLSVLGLAYQQRARETGDPTFYRLSAEALRRAQRAGGPRELILQAEASLANSRHRFGAGLKLARDALRLQPLDGSALGALGDALFNLGRYRQAFRVYDRMALLAPGVASFTRVASARELIGHRPAAAAADELALEAGSVVPENTAWAIVQLGNVDFNGGRLAAAARGYRRALRKLPGYVHAEAGLARVEASESHYAAAIARLRSVVARLPLPAYVILLGDTLHAAGHERAAQREYALVGAIERLFAANGVRTELQTALFDLDHDRHVADALRRARIAYRSAPSVYAEDALAWGLYRVGRCAEARAHSTHALRLGTRDALFFFHRAIVERCLGSSSARRWFERALATNPRFSIFWAPVARRALG